MKLGRSIGYSAAAMALPVELVPQADRIRAASAGSGLTGITVATVARPRRLS